MKAKKNYIKAINSLDIDNNTKQAWINDPDNLEMNIEYYKSLNKPSTEKQSETEPQPIVETPIVTEEGSVKEERKHKGIYGKSVEELKKQIDSDTDENPIGDMHNLGGMSSWAWRYVVKINNHFVYFENWGRDTEETYVVEWIFEDPNIAKKVAKEYNGKAEEVYYGEENQRWIRFDKIENALKYVLSLDDKNADNTEKTSNNTSKTIPETPVSEDKKVVAPTKPQGVEVPTEKKVGEKAVKQYSELTEKIK